MFDMKEIGCKIAKLRKEKNITQTELADQLGISFQAISNWERGESMPDIAKLVTLSQIFDISIDEILGNDRIAKTVSDIASGAEKEPLDTDTLKAIAPIVKPDKLSHMINDSVRLILDELCGLNQTVPKDASHITVSHSQESQNSQDTLKAQMSASQSTSDSPEIDLNQLKELAPFMDEDDLKDIVCSYADVLEDFDQILNLVKYLDEDDVADLIEKYSKSEVDFDKVLALAPYCCEDTLGDLALHYADDINNFSKVISLAPFLDEDVLNEIVNTKLDLSISMDQLKQLLPFLEEETVGKLARKVLLKK